LSETSVASRGVQAPAVSAIPAALSRSSARVEAVLEQVLPQPAAYHARVQEAMRYAIFAGGKRLRPFLTLQFAALFGAAETGAGRAAAAIEALHTYSLVHDDLPCMDDDDLRRGRPTTHKAFDDATAVLAGDALLTLAFEILADPATHPDGAVRCALVLRLAQAGGSEGMIGGQMMDIVAPEHSFGAEEVITLQRMKTGALFEFACEAGAILAMAGPANQQLARDYARDMGLAFQIADDLIDVRGSVELAGKAVGKDQDKGKATLVGLLGVQGAEAEAARLAASAADRLAGFGPEAELLRALPYFLLDRAN
jgi:farnesyl diphosphate synthase